MLQLTGKNNYEKFNKYLESRFSTTKIGELDFNVLSATWYWNKSKANAMADGGATVKEITARINSGVGQKEREDRYEEILKFFKVRR